ncbi:hypothetical protein MKX01_010546 [Papaver californicum]|nr:hypothetical protein MKX01_010546 [Papaver californicum]
MASLVSSFFLLSLLFFTQANVSSSALEAHSSNKVSIALYYETLCRGCSDYIIQYLPKIFENGLIDVIDLKLVPYGNAFLGKNSTIICQHGPKECYLNKLEACAIHVWPDLDKHFRFIYCVESAVSRGYSSEWVYCLKEPEFSAVPVLDCLNSGLGQRYKCLQSHNANETSALIPSHKYVPWVTVSKVPLYYDYKNLIKAVCNAYKGSPLPKACQEELAVNIPEAKPNQILEVCYVDETSSATKFRPGATWRMPQMLF